MTCANFKKRWIASSLAILTFVSGLRSSAQNQDPVADDIPLSMRNTIEFIRSQERAAEERTAAALKSRDLDLGNLPQTVGDITPDEVVEFKPIPTESIPDSDLEDLNSIVRARFGEIDVNFETEKFARILASGHRKDIETTIHRILNRLGIEHDPAEIKILVSAKPGIRVAISKNRNYPTIHVNLGFFAHFDNEDQLAAIIAHELTHRNIVQHEAQDDPAAVKAKLEKIKKRMEKYIGHVPGVDMRKQREELRADLGAIDRMIIAGYNPWEFYNAMEKTAKFTRSREVFVDDKDIRMASTFSHSHPPPDLRKAVAKAYISLRDKRPQLGKIKTKTTPFSPSMQWFHRRMKTYEFVMSPAGQKALRYSRRLAYTGAVISAAGAAHHYYGEEIKGAVIKGLGIGANKVFDAYEAVVGKEQKYNDYYRDSKPVYDNKGNFVRYERYRDPFSDNDRYAKDQGWFETAKDIYRSGRQWAEETSGIPAPVLEVSAVPLITGGLALGVYKWKQGQIDKKLDAFIEALSTDSRYRGLSNRLKKLKSSRKILADSESILAKNAKDPSRVFSAWIQTFEANWQLWLDPTIFKLNRELSNRKIKRDVALITDISDEDLKNESKRRLVALIDLGSEMLPSLNKTQRAAVMEKVAHLQIDELRHREVLASTERFENVVRALEKEIRSPIERPSALKLNDRSLVKAKLPLIEQRSPPSYLRLREKLAVLKRYRNFNFEEGTIEEVADIFLDLKRLGFEGDATLIAFHHFEDLNLYGLTQTKRPELLMELVNVTRNNHEFGLTEEDIRREKRNRRKMKFGFKPAWKEDATPFSKKILSLASKASTYRPETRFALLSQLGQMSLFHPYYYEYDRTPKMINEQKQALYKHFDSLGSMTKIDEWIRKEMLTRSIEVTQLTPFFNEYIQKNPQIIKTKKDAELIIGGEHYWHQYTNKRPSRLEMAIVESMKAIADSDDRKWKYDTAESEALQRKLLLRMEELGKMPANAEEKRVLWQQLTGKGITTFSDQVFADLYDESPPEYRQELRRLSQGRLWEPQLRTRILFDELQDTPAYQQLLATKDVVNHDRELRRQRYKNLAEVVKKVEKEFEFRGPDFDDAIERISNNILSTRFESHYLTKFVNGLGKTQQDLGVRYFGTVANEVLTWKKEDQWNFIQFLRGEAKPSQKIQEVFSSVGPYRIQRMFSLMPDIARAVTIDTILDSSVGLIGNSSFSEGYAKEIVDHVLKDLKPTAQNIAKDLLEAYVESFVKMEKSAQRSYVLAYLLASGKKQSSSGEALKRVLELYGTAGIKIGQFLVASGMLDPEDAKPLRSLQDAASPPLRRQIFKDVRRMGRGKYPKAKVGSLLGSASMKYAVELIDEETELSFVAKFLKADAKFNTIDQYKQFDYMVDALKKKHGNTYGIFGAIVNASQKAVERELSLPDEVRRAEIARKEVYARQHDVAVPRDLLLGSDVVGSDFAKGVKIDDVPEPHQSYYARRLIEIEREILFGDEKTFYFDPDRHPGNTKFNVLDEFGKPIKPIDFGQLIEMTGRERDQVIELFSISKIVENSFPSEWAAKKIAATMGLPESSYKAILKNLKSYFPTPNKNQLASYFSVLAALHDSGHTPKIQYFDFARAIVQVEQYKEFIKGDIITPVDILTERVTATAHAMAPEAKAGVTTKEKLREGAKIAKEKVQTLSSTAASRIRRAFKGDPCIAILRKAGMTP